MASGKKQGVCSSHHSQLHRNDQPSYCETNKRLIGRKDKETQMATTHKLALIGFGTVGQGLAEILLAKGDALTARYGVRFQIVAVSDLMKGSLYNPCLLYTSPSPRDRTRSRMPSSA